MENKIEKNESMMKMQSDLLYVLVPMIDIFIKESVNNHWIKSEDSGAFVMNIITNLINMLIRNSFDAGAPIGGLAQFLKEALNSLGAHMLVKLNELNEIEKNKEIKEVTPETKH